MRGCSSAKCSTLRVSATSAQRTGSTNFSLWQRRFRSRVQWAARSTRSRSSSRVPRSPASQCLGVPRRISGFRGRGPVTSGPRRQHSQMRMLLEHLSEQLMSLRAGHLRDVQRVVDRHLLCRRLTRAADGVFEHAKCRSPRGRSPVTEVRTLASCDASVLTSRRDRQAGGHWLELWRPVWRAATCITAETAWLRWLRAKEERLENR